MKIAELIPLPVKFKRFMGSDEQIAREKKHGLEPVRNITPDGGVPIIDAARELVAIISRTRFDCSSRKIQTVEDPKRDSIAEATELALNCHDELVEACKTMSIDLLNTISFLRHAPEYIGDKREYAQHCAIIIEDLERSAAVGKAIIEKTLT